MSDKQPETQGVLSKMAEPIEAVENRLIEVGRDYTKLLEWLNFFFWLAIVSLIVYDVQLAGDTITGNTWSELMRFYGRQLLILPWLLGVIIGHLFPHDDQLEPLIKNGPLGSPYGRIFWLTFGWLLASIILYGFDVDVHYSIMTIVAILGIFAGYTLWPIQRNSGLWTWGQDS